MERKWFTKPQRRIKNLSKAELDILLISETHLTYKNYFPYQVTNYATLPIQTELHMEALQYS